LLLFAAHLATGLVPLAVGYAILKHRLFDINVVVRRGLQYLLARNSLRIILALPTLALAYSIIANPDRTVREILFQNPFALGLIAAAALSLAFHQRFRVWLDRRFFREAYDQEQILLGLIEEVKELRSMSEVARAVSQKVEAALHPQRLYVFYREEHTRDLRLGYSSGESARQLNIAESSRLLRLMEGRKSAQEYASLVSAGLPAGEQARLVELQIELLVPMNGSDGRLLGLLMPGEKKSEQPYTATDRRLLFALAQQVADAYEIGWLKGRGQRRTTQA
jgi:sigma-B regulation protein RsbU (phosphoserine phosphatase)